MRNHLTPAGPRPRVRRAVLAAATALVLGLVTASSAVAEGVPSYQETEKITYPGSAGTGYALALSGDYAVVMKERETDAPGGGIVNVVRFDERGHVDQTRALETPAGAKGFGSAIALDMPGKRLVVGAEYSNTVYVFSYATGSWQLDKTLTPPAGSEATYVSRFGSSLSLAGDTVVIGAFASAVTQGGTYFNGSGAVFLGNVETGVTSYLPVNNPQNVATLGNTVAIDENFVVASAHSLRRVIDGRTYQTGGVYVWDRANLAAAPRFVDQPFTERSYLVPVTSGYGSGFGSSLELAGGALYVSAPEEYNYTAEDPLDPEGGLNDDSINSGSTTQGSVYVYNPATLERIGGKIIPIAHSWNAGLKVAAEGNALFISSYSENDQGEGEVSVYDLRTLERTVVPGSFERQTPVPVQILKPSDPQPDDYFGSALVGGGISASGSAVLIGSMGLAGRDDSSVYLFRPIVPNLEVLDTTVSAPVITYGQPGTVRVTVTGQRAPVEIEITLDGRTYRATTDASGRATLTLPAAAHPVGSYAVAATFISTDATQTGSATGDYRVVKANTVVTNTGIDVSAGG